MARAVCASLFATPPTPLILLPFASNGRRMHGFFPATVHSTFMYTYISGECSSLACSGQSDHKTMACYCIIIIMHLETLIYSKENCFFQPYFMIHMAS